MKKIFLYTFRPFLKLFAKILLVSFFLAFLASLVLVIADAVEMQSLEVVGKGGTGEPFVCTGLLFGSNHGRECSLWELVDRQLFMLLLTFIVIFLPTTLLLSVLSFLRNLWTNFKDKSSEFSRK